MGRRDSGAAEAAASAASDAARVMQARGQEVKAEKAEADQPAKSIMKEDEIASRRKNPRNDVLEDIAARRGPKPPEEEKAPEKPKAETKAETKTEESKVPEKPENEQPASEAAAATAAQAPKTVRVKVDGEEFDAPEADVEAAGGVRSYQIQRASENRLRKANEVLERAQKTQGDLTPLVTALLQAKAPPKQPEVTDAQFLESKMDVIRFGTPAEGAAALQEILGRIAPKPVDQNAIVGQAVDRFAHDQAVKRFDQKFKDISANPIRLAAAAAVRNQKIANIKGPIDWDSFYDNLGNEVRSAFGGQSQAAPAPAAATVGNPSPTSEKEARKASIVNLPAAAARAELPKEEKPESREDILNEMRRSRGLPVG